MQLEMVVGVALAGDDGGRVVVGVDGSPSALEALRWAAAYARATGACLEAVIAWQIPSALLMAGSSWGDGPSYDEMPPIDFAGAARGTLDEALDSVTTAPLRVESAVIEGHPRTVLVERSAGARLLVVGSRGRGGFVGLLLGSVSAHVAANARCPVTIVRQIEGDTATPA